MLGKLLKYEFKNTYKVVLIFLAATAIATLIGFLSLQTPIWQSFMDDRAYYDSFAADMLSIMSFFSIMFYIIMLVGVVYGAFIYLIVRFYKTMYTDEGYLLHTLPVTKHQILVSKIMASSIWLYLIYLALYASLGFFVISLIDVFTSDSVWLSLPSYYSEWQELMRDLDLGIGWLISASALTILGVPASIITFFGAVSIGQLFSKHRVLMAIVSYIGIMIVSSIVRAFFRVGAEMVSSAPLYITGQAYSRYLVSTLNAQLVASLLIAVGCYIASYYITSKNLNLD